MKNIFLSLLFILAFFLGHSLVRVENERYALETGICRTVLNPVNIDFNFLNTVETRTHWL